MATTNNITTSYAGEEAGKYIAPALLNSPTLASRALTIDEGIKFKKPLRPTTVTGLIKDASCDFNATGTVTTTERVLQPKELDVNLEFCKKDYRETWDAKQLINSTHDDLPKNFSDFIIAQQIAQVAQNNETSIWTGDNTNSGEYDGFTTLIAADANLPSGQEVAGTTITPANVRDEIGDVVDATPERVLSRADYQIYVSPKVFRAYKRALGNAGYLDRFNNQDINATEFDGIKIFKADGLSGDVMFASYVENLHFGTSLIADHNEVKLIDMAETDGSQNVRFVMRFTGGVQYALAQDIVTYGITNSAN